MTARKRLGIVLAVVVVTFAFALAAWAAVYRYGNGEQTLVYNPTNYDCPGTQKITMQYTGNHFFGHDSYGYAVFKVTVGGVDRVKYTPNQDWDADHGYQWDTPYLAGTYFSWNPVGLNINGDMEAAVWCESR
jgi:hypothetical protein